MLVAVGHGTVDRSEKTSIWRQIDRRVLGRCADDKGIPFVGFEEKRLRVRFDLKPEDLEAF